MKSLAQNRKESKKKFKNARGLISASGKQSIQTRETKEKGKDRVINQKGAFGKPKIFREINDTKR